MNNSTREYLFSRTYTTLIERYPNADPDDLIQQAIDLTNRAVRAYDVTYRPVRSPPSLPDVDTTSPKFPVYDHG